MTNGRQLYQLFVDNIKVNYPNGDTHSWVQVMVGINFNDIMEREGYRLIAKDKVVRLIDRMNFYNRISRKIHQAQHIGGTVLTL